jgi:hypothetical protein
MSLRSGYFVGKQKISQKPLKAYIMWDRLGCSPRFEPMVVENYSLRENSKVPLFYGYTFMILPRV